MNYKLIKKLPFENSPEIGYISKPHSTQKNNIHYWNHSWFNPEEYPEFWEKVVEKDYEILSLVGKGCSVPLRILDKNTGLYKHAIIDSVKSLDLNYLLNSGYNIYSIKRLSDGEIFTIGDTIANMCNSKQKINELYICKDDKMCVYTSTTCRFTINNIKKAKSPLFTTEDGLDIFKGDQFYFVRDIQDWSIGFQFASDKEVCKTYKRFSTKEKAEEYILLNKPCLSYNEVLNAVKIRNKNTFDTLKALVKSK